MAEDKDAGKDDGDTIVIKKIVKGGGHHGGAWKVAYADFVTAMMAFFLLLWLLNVSTDEQLNAISNYFDPTAIKVSDSNSGAGGVMGGLTMSPQGAMASNVQPIASPPTPSGKIRSDAESQTLKPKSTKEKAVEKAKDIMKREEQKSFEEKKKQLMQAVLEDASLAGLSENILIDITPEGLRIQIIDKDGKPLFASGSAKMFQKTKDLVTKITAVIKDLPNEISIRGHTDSVPFTSRGKDFTNWELSAERANATRRVMNDAEFPADKVNNVVGKGDKDPLFPDDPENAQNRRISIILLREELTNPDYNKKAEEVAEELNLEDDFIEIPKEEIGEKPSPKVPMGTFRRTPGNVEFP